MRRLFLLTAALMLTVCATAGAATLYVSPTGSGSSCSAVAPCRDFTTAYRVAKPGDLVQVASGTYPSQTLDDDPSKGSNTADVTFDVAQGATVVLGGLDMGDSFNPGASHVTLKNMDMVPEVKEWEGSTGIYGNTDVTLINMKLRAVWLQGVHDFTMKGGEAGRNKVKSGLHVWEDYVTDKPSTNVVFDGVQFHDVIAESSGAHQTCVDVGAVDGLTFRNSRFGPNCDTYDLKISDGSTYPAKNITIENNVFEPCVSTYVACQGALQMFDGTNVKIRNNSINDYLTIGNGTAGRRNLVNVKVVNTAARFHTSQCDSRVTYSHNFNIGDTEGCSPTDQWGDPKWTAGMVPNTGSPLIDRGDTVDYAPTDRNGVARPVGFAPDVGASETGGTTAPPPPVPVDTDGDGVPDTADACPNVVGAQADGCPVPPPPPPADPCTQTAAERDRALADLAAMTESRDAWKARALKAEDQLLQVKTIIGG